MTVSVTKPKSRF